MGVSTSVFMCGCKLFRNQKVSKSKKSLLSTGSTNTGVSARSSDTHLVISEDNYKLQNNSNLTEYPLFDSNCKSALITPCFQAMNSQDRDHKDSSDTLLALHIGSMKITKPQFKALLIFSKKDELFQSWQDSLTQLGFHCDLAATIESGLEIHFKLQHHLVVIANHFKRSDVASLCRLIRESSIGAFTTIVGVLTRRYKPNNTSAVKLPCFLGCNFYKRNQIDEGSKTRDLLNMGLDRIISDTCTAQELEEEILQLEAGPLTLRLKFRSIQTGFIALEHSRDVIMITDSNFQIQYVNRSYVRVSGFSREEVIGKNLSYYFENETNEEDAWERTKKAILSGKEWEGNLYTKHSCESDFQLHFVISPLANEDSSINQYLVQSQSTGNHSHIFDIASGSKRKNSHEFYRRASGTAEQLQGRRSSVTSLFDGSDSAHRRTNSLAKIHSMSVQAPITQIINLIRNVKDSSQPSVGEVLDQILDILRNSELYAPADLTNRSRDPMLSDFVEGLVTGTGFSHRRSSGGTGEHLFGRNLPSGSFKTSSQYHPSMLTVDPKITRSLEKSDSWDYDVLELERITAKKPLVHLGMHTLEQFDACEILECSQTTLHSWLVAIESNYHSSNSYHNSTHAADVLHATAYFLKKERVKTWMEPLDEVAALLAAVIHDVDHPGRTNAFLVNSNNPLALLYNDTAVLESHHAAFTFKFTASSESCNIFKNMSSENFRSLRQSIIDMVLATELSRHFEHVNKFVSIVTKNNSNNTPVSDQDLCSILGRNSGAFSLSATHELKILIKRMMIKVADVINPARKKHLCVEWARRISEEYFAQVLSANPIEIRLGESDNQFQTIHKCLKAHHQEGVLLLTDEEKRRGLPVVMPHFDRKTCSLPKSQRTFIDYFLTDMFEAWHEFCGLDEVITNLKDNVQYWRMLEDRGIMRLEELGDDIFIENEPGEALVKQDSVDENSILGNHLLS